MANQIQGRDNGGAGRRQSRRAGTVLMECVLVLPLLTLLVFAIVQFALIWNAQIMTHYAAYNAARAALVYNPEEYRKVDNATGKPEPVFRSYGGVCWEAACRTLAWVSSSPDDKGGSELRVPGWFGEDIIPNSSHVLGQVRISPDPEDSVEYEDRPAVKVTVEFDYPLYIPVIGRMVAYFSKIEEHVPSRWEVTGWSPPAGGIEALDTIRHPLMKVDYITLTGTAVLPKPWKTTRFALRPASSSAR